MFGVLSLFLIPIGGGIPAGVLLAEKLSLPWPLTALLYFVSDVILALIFEPLMLGAASLGARVPFLASKVASLRKSFAERSARYGTGAGPIWLVMIAFGIDPMTGRSAAAVAGHGFVTGWALAITGDMMFFGVVMAVTLKLRNMFGSPDAAVAVVLLLMFLIPVAVRKVRGLFRRSEH